MGRPERLIETQQKLRAKTGLQRAARLGGELGNARDADVAEALNDVRRKPQGQYRKPAKRIGCTARRHDSARAEACHRPGASRRVRDRPLCPKLCRVKPRQ